MNSENEIKLRHYRTNLRNSGSGFIIFAFWGIIKFLMIVTMKRQYFWDMIGMDPEAFYSESDRVLVFALGISAVLIFMLIVLLIHLFIGIGAIKFGRGKSQKQRFFHVAVIMFVLSVLGLTYYIPGLGGVKTYSDTILAAMLVDMATAYILFDMIHSTSMIKKLLKQEKEHKDDPENIPADTPENTERNTL